MAVGQEVRRQVFDRAAGGAPGVEAAIEHGDIAMAHGAEHPPDARGCEEAVLVVADHAMAIAEAEPADARGKLLRRRQHVGQGAVGVGDIVDVEEARAGNVVGVVGLPAGLRRAGHEVRAVEHAHVRRGQVRLQPVGGDDRLFRRETRDHREAAFRWLSGIDEGPPSQSRDGRGKANDG